MRKSQSFHFLHPTLLHFYRKIARLEDVFFAWGEFVLFVKKRVADINLKFNMYVKMRSYFGSTGNMFN